MAEVLFDVCIWKKIKKTVPGNPDTAKQTNNEKYITEQAAHPIMQPAPALAVPDTGHKEQ